MNDAKHHHGEAERERRPAPFRGVLTTETAARGGADALLTLCPAVKEQ